MGKRPRSGDSRQAETAYIGGQHENNEAYSALFEQLPDDPRVDEWVSDTLFKPFYRAGRPTPIARSWLDQVRRTFDAEVADRVLDVRVPTLTSNQILSSKPRQKPSFGPVPEPASPSPACAVPTKEVRGHLSCCGVIALARAK
jgi:hypothetical protein